MPIIKNARKRNSFLKKKTHSLRRHKFSTLEHRLKATNSRAELRILGNPVSSQTHFHLK